MLAHIPGKANEAAYFLSRMKSDPNQTEELKLQDSIPTRDILVHPRAKTPDVTISNFELPEEFLATSEENSISPEITAALKSHPSLLSEVQNVLKVQEPGTAKRVGDFFKIKRLVQINSIQDSDSQNKSSVYQNETLPVDLEQEQKKDEDMKQVVQWLSHDVTKI